MKKLLFPLTDDLKKNIKLQIFAGLSFILLFIKLFFSPTDSFPINIINEILVVLIVSSLVIYFIDLLSDKTINPLSLVMNVGIINAILFFLIAFSDSIINVLFDNLSDQIKRANLVFNFITFLYGFLLLIIVSYIFLTFKEMYYLKKNKRVSIYFNTMIVFFILASLSAQFNGNNNLSYINDTFLIISVFLIVINSIRISWIAFLSKKEKLSILFLSVVITILFIINLVNSSSTNVHSQLMTQFSPPLNEFTKIIMIYGIIYFGILFFTTLFHIPTAEAFDRKAQEVTSLQYFSKLITQVLDFEELSETITDIGMKICNANAAWIIWKNDKESNTIANKNIGLNDAKNISQFILKEDLQIKTTAILDIDHLKQRLELNENYTSISLSPLKSHNQLRGYLVAAKKENFFFDDEDKNALDTFSDYASVSIENSRLLEESIEKERLEKELDVAREIQRKILPAKNPVYENLEISSVFIPAFEVGGDYYDFFNLDKNKLAFVIADVSGKGISAAFVMAELKGIFHSLSKTFESPKEILIRANQILKGTLDRKSFVSAAYGVIDFKEKTLKIARAGHCPILLLRNNKSEDLRPSGLGLGLNFSTRFSETLEEIQIDLINNDSIVLYTDGISEAKNAGLEDFGDKKFHKILLENINKTPEQISNSVIKEITLFSRDNQQYDDITLVILKWKQNLKLDGEKEWQNLTPQSKTKVK